MSKFILLFVLIISSCIKQSDNAVTVEDINTISILEFSSNESIKQLLKIRNRNKLREILYISLLATTNNISNYNTTKTEVINTPYKPQYVFVDVFFKWEIMGKEVYKYIHDPSHPDAIRDGEMSGFVKYPDIDFLEEEQNLTKIFNILFSINK